MSIIETIISLYAPLQCLACGVDGRIACDGCIRRLPLTESCCYRCQQPSRLGRTCAACRPNSKLVSANAATNYEGWTKDLIWRLKFERAQSAAEIMAERLALLYGSLIAEDVLIVPLPTARRRVRGRGYDQAVLIARALAKRTGRRYAPLLMRLGSQEQIGANKQQRQAQLQDVFRVKRPGLARGARILLIDDVMTTGASLESAAATLHHAGAKTIGSLVFARA